MSYTDPQSQQSSRQPERDDAGPGVPLIAGAVPGSPAMAQTGGVADTQAVAQSALVPIHPTLALSYVLSSGRGSDEVAKILDETGGICCSHDVMTVEGLALATRLLGAKSEKIQDVNADTILEIRGWLLCSASKLHDDGEVSDFLALTFDTDKGVVRSSSHWVRRTFGLILTSQFGGRDWEPIRVKVQRRPLQVGALLALGFEGFVNDQQREDNGKHKAKKKTRG